MRATCVQGGNIGLNTKGLLRNQKVFGEDANFFRPERWFERDRTLLANMDRVHDLVFGGGQYAIIRETDHSVEFE